MPDGTIQITTPDQSIQYSRTGNLHLVTDILMLFGCGWCIVT